MHKIIAISLLLTLPMVAFPQKKLIDEVVAVVGDNAVLRSDIEYQYEQALVEGISNYGGDMKCHVFEQILIQKLMLNQAKLDSIEVSENEVVNQVDSRMNYFIQRIGDKEKLEEYFNKSLLQIKRDQMEMVRTQMLTQQMQREITKNIKVTPAQIRAYYRSLPEDSLPLVPTQYEIQQIVVYPKVEQEEIERVKSQLRDFQRQVNEGRDFATLAVLYSEDPGSAAHGGDMGWYTRGGFVPEFATAAFNLQEKNKVSKIVETEFGYHIIQLIDRKGERINVRHILMKPKISEKNRTEAKNFLDSISTYIESKKMTFEEAAIHFSMDKESRSNGGIMVNPENGSTKFEIGQIPAEIAKSLQSLKEGEMSKPFFMMDERKGKETYRMIVLKRKIDPHRANLAEDYKMMQDMLENSKRSQAVKDWIIKKQKETYITIDKNWRNCEFEYKNWLKD
jgi:peptidyl-prolyl cis-trans isomerase SurA